MIFDFFNTHIYILLFFLSIIEGPITSFTSAGFAAQGSLNIRYIVSIMIVGDLIGDIILYFIGRLYHKIKILQKFKLFSKEKKYLTNILKKNQFLFFLTVKTTPYLSAPSLIFTGIKKIKFLYFFLYSFSVSIIVKIIYLSIGYFGAISISQLTKFLNGRKQIIVYLVFGIITFILIKKFYSYLPKLIKKESKK